MFLAYSIDLYATDAGSEPGSDFTIGTPTLPDQASSCSIAAALKVSQAEIIPDPLSLKIFPIFPIVVVFPTPLTPDTKVIFNFSLFSKKSFL